MVFLLIFSNLFQFFYNMKISFLFFPILLAIFMVSCGNSANNHSEPQEGVDSLASKRQTEVSKGMSDDNGTLETYEVNKRHEDIIDNKLDSFERMISEVRDQFFVDDQYMAPPGHRYHTHIHPLIELYEDLHSRQEGMSTEQLSRFRKLTRRIMDTF